MFAWDESLFCLGEMGMLAKLAPVGLTGKEEQVYEPGLDHFRALAGGPANLVPVYREFPADLETPVSVYLKLMQSGQPSFLLESVEHGEIVGRYSFVGVDPRGMLMLTGRSLTMSIDGELSERELTPGEDILHVIEAELGQYQPAPLPGLPRLIGGAVGYLGYDTVRFLSGCRRRREWR